MRKPDLKSAFRILGLNPESFKWLVLKACHPITGELSYFIDKCLPFGSSISCVHFQRFSNALKTSTGTQSQKVHVCHKLSR